MYKEYADEVLINNPNNFNSGGMEQLSTLYNIIKATCKVKYPNVSGSGFLMKTKKGNNIFFCLVTNEHVITKQMVKTKSIIEISYDNETKKFRIILDKSQRFIMDYRYMNIDAIIIQILPMDNIPFECFLSPNLNFKKGYEQFLGRNIFIPQFPGGQNLQGSEGYIKKINKCTYDFIHLASTDMGSSGSPIFLKNSSQVIGIHKGGCQDRDENLGKFIGPIIDSLEKDFDYVEEKMYGQGMYKGEINYNLREGYGKFNDNGIFYIGQWYNDKRQGYGIEYTLYQINQFNIKKKIIYEGQFFDNVYNGYGKYIWQNLDYYEGEFVNGLCNGKGQLYNNNGILIYDGYFFNNNKQGFGMYNYGNGIIYKGLWSNDKENGEGELYENNILLFKGFFINGKKNMIGTEYFLNGNIKYYGGFIDNIKNGNGVEYFENGNKKYEGGFMNGQKAGKGWEFYENGNVKYSGYFLDGQKNGCGIENYEDGHKKYEGSFMNDMYEEKGTFYYEKKKINNGNQSLYINNINIKEKIYYEGYWKKGKREGNGSEYYPNGVLKYAGSFLNDRYHGYGQLFWNIKDSSYNYIGSFIDGKKYGKGEIYQISPLLSYSFSDLLNTFNNEIILEYPENEIKEYKGNFKDDKKEGLGTCIYINGNKYVGNWKNDSFDGYGQYYIEDSIYYEGGFAKGKREGEGVEFYIEGPKKGMIKYQGTFHENLYNGYGEFYYRDGESYKGFWNNGVKHGQGSFLKENGEVMTEGEFKNGNAPFSTSTVRNIFSLIKCDGKTFIKNNIFN